MLKGEIIHQKEKKSVNFLSGSFKKKLERKLNQAPSKIKLVLRTLLINLPNIQVLILGFFHCFVQYPTLSHIPGKKNIRQQKISKG